MILRSVLDIQYVRILNNQPTGFVTCHIIGSLFHTLFPGDLKPAVRRVLSDTYMNVAPLSWRGSNRQSQPMRADGSSARYYIEVIPSTPVPLPR